MECCLRTCPKLLFLGQLIKPPLQTVPSGTGIITTLFVASQVPTCLPSGEQIDWPGLVQVVDVEGDPEDVEPVDELEIGEDAALDGEAASGEAATLGAAPATAEVAAGEVLDPDAAAAEPSVAPPEPILDDEPELAAPPELVAEPLPPEAPASADDPEPPDPPAAAGPSLQPSPVGGFRAEGTPNLSTYWPGSGNCASVVSATSQTVVGMFATNIFGNEGVSRSVSVGMVALV